jgi:isocitrate lyase
MESAVYRSLSYAPYVDMLWVETSTPDLDQARVFAESIHARFPGKLLAYNCSPSFNWRKHLDVETIGRFQRELGSMGYRFQFITLAGFHAINATMFELASEYAENGMAAYTVLQEKEFAMASSGYTATRHQREVGAGYFDKVAQAIAGGRTSTLSMYGSMEEAQFSAAADAAGISNGAVAVVE